MLSSAAAAAAGVTAFARYWLMALLISTYLLQPVYLLLLHGNLQLVSPSSGHTLQSRTASYVTQSARNLCTWRLRPTPSASLLLSAGG
jgi:hypothetical protein